MTTKYRIIKIQFLRDFNDDNRQEIAKMRNNIETDRIAVAVAASQRIDAIGKLGEKKNEICAREELMDEKPDRTTENIIKI